MVENKGIIKELAINAFKVYGRYEGKKSLADSANDTKVNQSVVSFLKEAVNALEYDVSVDEIIGEIKETELNNDSFDFSPEDMIKQSNGFAEIALLYRKKFMLAYYSADAIACALSLEEDTKNISDKQILKDKIKEVCGLNFEKDLIQLIYERCVEAFKGNREIADKDKIKLLKKAFHSGCESEIVYHGCAQSTLLSLFGIVGNVNKELFQVANGFGGGMSQCGDGNCGSYSAGAMFTGLYVGKSYDKINNDRENQYKGFYIIQELHDRFIDAFGSITCMKIHESTFGKGFLLRDQKQKEEFNSLGGHKDKCPYVVGTGTAWITEILLNKKILSLDELKIK